MSIISYPKVNLALDILNKDPSGYHEIRTVFHQLSQPFDELFFEELPSGEIKIICDNPEVPCDKTNTVFAAARALQQNYGIRRGVKITIKKRIPLRSGLGGGASNGAAALRSLAQLWNICHCEPSLGLAKQSSSVCHAPDCIIFRLAPKIGMDCTFFLHGGTALGEHFGEKITPLPSLPPELQFEIIETGVSVSTRSAYEMVNLARCGANIEKTQQLIAAIHASDAQKILKNIHNDFEEFVFEKYPKIKAATHYSLQTTHYPLLLCGSGGALAKLTLKHLNALSL